jgi:hypothetical protein
MERIVQSVHPHGLHFAFLDPHNLENRRTSLREAEKHVGDKYTGAVLDSLYVIECSMRHFFLRAEMRKLPTRRLI